MYFMRIDNLHYHQCFVCRHSGKSLVFFPQEHTSTPILFDTGWGFGEWYGYLKNEHRDPDAPRSKHMKIQVCKPHFDGLWVDWESNARMEVEMSNVFADYIERAEGGREVLYDG